MKVRSVIIENPNLLEVLAFFEDAYRMGNFVSGKYILQTQEKFNLEAEINKLRETIKQKDLEIQALILQQPTRTT